MLFNKRVLIICTVCLVLAGCSPKYYSNYYINDILIENNTIKLMIYCEKRAYKKNFLNPHGGRTWTVESSATVFSYKIDLQNLEDGMELAPDSTQTPWIVEGGVERRDLKIVNNGVMQGVKRSSRNRNYVIKNDNMINTRTGSVVFKLSDDKNYSEFLSVSESNFKEAYTNGHSDTWPRYRIANNGRYITSTTDTYLVPETDYFDFKRVNIFDIKDSSFSYIDIDKLSPDMSMVTIKDLEYMENKWVGIISYYQNNQAKCSIWDSESGILEELPVSYITNTDKKSPLMYLTDADRYDIWDANNKFFAKWPSFAIKPKSSNKVEIVISSYERNNVYRVFLNFDMQQIL